LEAVLRLVQAKAESLQKTSLTGNSLLETGISLNPAIGTADWQD